MNKYSTLSEVITGEWIDGSPIYRKTIDFGALPDTTSKSVDIGTSIKRLIHLEGVAFRASDNTNFPLPFVAAQASAAQPDIQVIVMTTQIMIQTAIDRSNLSAYITLYYVK